MQKRNTKTNKKSKVEIFRFNVFSLSLFSLLSLFDRRERDQLGFGVLRFLYLFLPVTAI